MRASGNGEYLGQIVRTLLICVGVTYCPIDILNVAAGPSPDVITTSVFELETPTRHKQTDIETKQSSMVSKAVERLRR